MSQTKLTLESFIKNITNGKKVLILGIGKENQQFVEWLTNVVKIPMKSLYLADKNTTPNLPENWSTPGKVFFGEGYLDSLKNESIEYVFKAPGIWSLLPQLVDFRNQRGQDKVQSSLVFFIEKFRKNIVGVTGTKGKSTTSALINHLLIDAGLDSNYCGNTTGVSPYTFWTDLNQQIQEKQFFVIELSSFQLQDLAFAKVSPSYSVITNYYVDHLDQHGNKQEYWSCKNNIFKFQDQETDLIISNSQVLEYSTELEGVKNSFIVDDLTVDRVHEFIDHQLIGRHNQFNVTQAIIMTESVISKVHTLGQILIAIEGLSLEYKQALSTFKPLSHRLELVRSEKIIKDGVQINLNFYDDGFATDYDGVIAAINSLTSKDEDFTWLILSGKDKGCEQDNNVLVSQIQSNFDKGKFFRIEYCGQIGQNISRKLGNPELETINLHKTTEEMILNFELHLQTFRDFIYWKGLSKANLNIVLSPGGSSFDEFENYYIRSQWWVEQMRSVKL